MGSCHSVPIESTTGSATTSQVEKGVVEGFKSSQKPNSVSVSRKTTNGSAHTPLSPAQSSSYTTTNQMYVSNETTEHTSHGSAEDPTFTPPGRDDQTGGETAAVMPWKKKKDFSLPSRKDSFRSQCSSASSCDSSERANSSTLREWKNELAGGDLSTTVVRIEASYKHTRRGDRK
jgi:hypothetical protein